MVIKKKITSCKHMPIENKISEDAIKWCYQVFLNLSHKEPLPTWHESPNITVLSKVRRLNSKILPGPVPANISRTVCYLVRWSIFYVSVQKYIKTIGWSGQPGEKKLGRTECRTNKLNQISSECGIEPIPHSPNSSLALLSPSATRKHFRPKTVPSLRIISMLSAKQLPWKHWRGSDGAL